MRKTIFIILNLLLGFTAPVLPQAANYLISTNYQDSHSFSSFDLFNFSISNFSGHPSEIRLEINVTESKSNTPLIHLVNTHFSLKSGINVFSNSDFVIEYFENERSKYFQSGIPLYSGSYEICISLDVLQGENGQVRECTQLNLSNDFFIHLLTPDDREEIETLNPLLQWITNLPNDNNIRYHLVLTPLEPFEIAEDALGHNLKYIEINLDNRQFLYPLNAPQLIYGKQYAWQVFALTDDKVIGVSEAWIFTPVNRNETIIEKKDCYRVISKNFNNGNYLYGSIMKFAYQNNNSEQMLNYSIGDLNTGKMISDPPRVPLKAGLNKIELQLKRLKGIKEGHQYIIVIRNSNNETYKLTFNPYSKKQMRE